MEYFLGSIVTLAAIFFTKKYLTKTINTKIKPTRFSQTRAFELSINIIKAAIQPKEIPNSQSIVHYNKSTLKILILEKLAYWIKDNGLYVADIVDGDIDHDSTREVDTMDMDKVQLEKMIYIVEQLREGMPNDSWDSGQSKF
jgi:hypothetical protein